jgi:hypothetical protein
VLVRADLGDAEPVFVGSDQFETTTDELGAGVVHFAVPFDDHWTLSVDGESIDARRAFGETTAFDVGTPGIGALRYDSPLLRLVAVIVQAAMWIAVLVLVSRIQVPGPKRRATSTSDEPLIDLTAEPIGSAR